MLSEQLFFQAVELLLAATFKTPQDGRGETFLFGPPGSSEFTRNIPERLFHTKVGLLKAALHIRNLGPTYLHNLSIKEIETKLTDFLVENYWILSQDFQPTKANVSFADCASTETTRTLASALRHSEIFAPHTILTLFPLVPFQVENGFDSESFFLIRPSELNEVRLGQSVLGENMLRERFPPFAYAGENSKPVGAWLGVRSPTHSTSKKLRNVILGATSLLLPTLERHLFSTRSMFGGWITPRDGVYGTLGNAHTPPIYKDIVITTGDHEWLHILANKLDDPDADARKHAKALEYYYRAWSLSEAERFPILCMALDAIFGDASRATQAVVDAVSPLMDVEYDHTRIRMLLSLRAAVIHGGAPDVFEARKYLIYYERYFENPVTDLELIVARSIQHVVFNGALVSRPQTPNQTIRETYGIVASIYSF